MKNLESLLPPVEERSENRIIEQIHQSTIYQNYSRAFTEATGLSLRLASADGQVVSDSNHHANPFCGLLGEQHKSCQACVRAWRNLTLFGQLEPHTSTCFAGLCESCVPIRTGGGTIGYLLTGEITTARSTQAKFASITRLLEESGITFEQPQLRRAYFSTRIMSHRHYASIIGLLQVFADHLGLVANQLVIRDDNSESPDIHRAREFIRQHLTEPLELRQVADSANLSSCYFSRKFKESTGLTFTSYVTRTRVEAAKTLLANPHVRVSEVAFEVGFQSLTHFNRAFKEVTGRSPTSYRHELPDAVLNPDPHPALPASGQASSVG